ncbi:DUF4007 family protein [Emcibacter sp.]|uniref:DUF4007 family protein n=1 Tax=Emcibacter sp. TaxID=1979954 RepID=UPI002AA7BF82|nr:DUF4007 family protein [Emcibacter sp.]
MKIKLTDEKYKPQFAGHETFALRYGWLKKAFDEVQKAGDEARKVFTEDSAIATFGVGRNMVSAIRFWAHACNVIQTIDNETTVSDTGRLIFDETGFDPYLENPSSLWLLHWHLASEPKNTSIHWTFNYFNESAFEKDTLAKSIREAANRFSWKSPNEKTLNSDLLVLLNTYSLDVTAKKGNKEDNLGSPLAELGLLRSSGGNRVHLGWGVKPSLGMGTFLYSLCDFWQSYSGANTLNFQAILLEPGSPGRVFLMDENDLAVRLMDIEEATSGIVSWSETAGLKQLIRKEPFSDSLKAQFLALDYPEKSNCIEAA